MGLADGFAGMGLGICLLVLPYLWGGMGAGDCKGSGRPGHLVGVLGHPVLVLLHGVGRRDHGPGGALVERTVVDQAPAGLDDLAQLYSLPFLRAGQRSRYQTKNPGNSLRGGHCPGNGSDDLERNMNRIKTLAPADSGD